LFVGFVYFERIGFFIWLLEGRAKFLGDFIVKEISKRAERIRRVLFSESGFVCI
jgi:hypothetical protein